MKTGYIFLVIALFFPGIKAESQILKKLKKKVESTTEKVLLKKTEEKTEESANKAFDEVTGAEATGETPSSNPARDINTAVKRSFYTSDLVVSTSGRDGVTTINSFDSDELALRGESSKMPNPIFIDSEGYQYAYNESRARWEKTGIMRTDAMSFMMPAVSMSLLKLPPEPMLKATEEFKKKGMNLNTFQMVEWAFIYKPEHFRNSGFTETSVPCGNGAKCAKFFYTDPEYAGSWILFDSEGRLSRIYAKVNSDQVKDEGTYNFEYKPVEVRVPAAVEVKMPFQDLYMEGLNTSTSGSPSPGGATGSNLDNNKNPEEGVLRIDPDNPFSFPGITTVLQAKGQKITMLMDIQNQVMKVISDDKKTPPFYFEKNNYIVVDNKDGCIRAKFDLTKAFSQIEEGMKGKTLPPNLNVEQAKANFYKSNYGINLLPGSFPIADWAYVYKPEFFQNAADFEKSNISCGGSSCTKYTMKNGKEKGSYVLFDNYGRLSEIFSTVNGGGTVSYTYEPHSISAPSGCQEIDMNNQVLSRMMGGM